MANIKTKNGKTFYEVKRFSLEAQFKSKKVNWNTKHYWRSINKRVDFYIAKEHEITWTADWKMIDPNVIYAETALKFIYNMYIILTSKLDRKLNHPFFSKNECERYVDSLGLYSLELHEKYDNYDRYKNYLKRKYDNKLHKEDFIKNFMDILNVSDQFCMFLPYPITHCPDINFKTHKFHNIAIGIAKKLRHYMSAIYNAANQIHEKTCGEFELNFDLDIVDNQNIKAFKNSNKTQEEINTFIIDMMLNDNNFPIKYKTQIKLWQMKMPWSNTSKFSNTEIINKLYENSNDYKLVLFGKNIEFNVQLAYDTMYSEDDEEAKNSPCNQPGINGNFNFMVVEQYERENEEEWNTTNKIKIFDINAVEVFDNMYSSYNRYGKFVKYISSHVEKYNFNNIDEITKNYHDYFLKELLQYKNFKEAYGMYNKNESKNEEWNKAEQEKRNNERMNKKTQSEKKSNNTNNQKNESKQNSSQSKSKNKNQDNITNYLLILRLDKLTTKEDLSKHYKELVKYYHPDVNNSENAGEMLKLINNAYSVLQSMF